MGRPPMNDNGGHIYIRATAEILFPAEYRAAPQDGYALFLNSPGQNKI